jgi:hypothetical protein
MHRLSVVLVVALAFTLAACGSEAGSDGDSSTTRLAQDYVRAINARDGEGVCALLTEEATEQLSLTDEDFPCARAVAGLIGYVEDSGSPEFLRYESVDAKAGSERQGFRSVRLALEARFHTESDGGNFEVCRFEDTVWFTHEAGGWRIAKPSLALYAAFGVGQFPAGTLAPPSAGASGDQDGGVSRLEVLTCQRDAGAEAASSAGGKWNAASLAEHLAEDEDHFVDVRCIDAAGHEGWDFVCTYFDPTLGKRMKVGHAVEADGMALVGSGSVPADSWLPPRS